MSNVGQLALQTMLAQTQLWCADVKSFIRRHSAVRSSTIRDLPFVAVSNYQ